MTSSQNNFGKHYASMYEGSMVGAGPMVFAVMGYVIAKQEPETGEKDSRMVVELNPVLLAFILGEKEPGKVAEAIEFLCQPDESSRSEGEGGRRLVKVGQFGYWVVNGRKYRNFNDAERRKEQNRAAAARHREKKKLVLKDGESIREYVKRKAAEDPLTKTIVKEFNRIEAGIPPERIQVPDVVFPPPASEMPHAGDPLPPVKPLGIPNPAYRPPPEPLRNVPENPGPAKAGDPGLDEWGDPV